MIQVYFSMVKSDMTHVVNSELQKIVQWLNANKLSINIEKTKYIVFTS